MYGIEEVNGIIIGEFTTRVELVSPSGKVQRQGHVPLIDADSHAQKWAKEEMDKIKNQMCGDGKPLSAHPDILESIYGKGQWSMRIYE